jgi:hypothetical protein
MTDSIITAFEVCGNDDAWYLELAQEVKGQDLVENVVDGTKQFPAAILLWG